MCEQDNQVIITFIVIKTFVSLILDCNKVHTILKLILLALTLKAPRKDASEK